MIYLLDACTLLAYVKKEPEGVKVKELFDRAGTLETAILMSVINLTEVYYGLIRYDGMEIAEEIMKSLDDLPFSVIDTVTRSVSRDTARFKVSYSMSLADTYLCATAKSLSAVIRKVWFNTPQQTLFARLLRLKRTARYGAVRPVKKFIICGVCVAAPTCG